MGTKISDLTALTGAGLATGDKFPVVDVSAGTSGTKSMTAAELNKGLPTLGFNPATTGIMQVNDTTQWNWNDGAIYGETDNDIDLGSSSKSFKNLYGKGNLIWGSDATDRVSVKGIYMSPANVSVAVPTIANDAAENGDSVAVDVSTAFSMQPAVGDAVIAIPQEALPTDCLLCGAYVTATDTITVTFMSKEGGGGVTGASKNFKFLVIDLT